MHHAPLSRWPAKDIEPELRHAHSCEYLSLQVFFLGETSGHDKVELLVNDACVLFCTVHKHTKVKRSERDEYIAWGSVLQWDE